MSTALAELIEQKDLSLEDAALFRRGWYSDADVRAQVKAKLKEASADLQALVAHMSRDHVASAELAGRRESAVALLIRGHNALRDRDYDNAEKHFDKLESGQAGFADGLTGLVEVAIARGEPDKLLKRAEGSLKKNGSNPDFLVAVARVRSACGDQEGAEQLLRHAVAIHPTHRDALFHLGELAFRYGHDDEALELWERCAAMRPVHRGAMLNLAVAYEDLNRYDLAVVCYKQILRDYPDDQLAQRGLYDAQSSQSEVIDERALAASEKIRSILNTPMTDFELSVRSRNCLARMNIKTLGDLIKRSEAELLAFKNFGETSLAEIKDILTQKGLRLGQDINVEEYAKKAEALNRFFPKVDKDVVNKPVADLKLSVRSRRAIESLGVVTVGDLLNFNENDLMRCKNFGQTSLNEIKQKLAELGLRLKSLDEM
jgi:DNA-directed RNA polymerase subunit alpha